MNTGATLAWLILAVILFLIEGVTFQMVCIWFACGSLVAMAAAWAGASLSVQLFLFLISSLLILVVGRPFLKKRLKVKKSATNADQVIGQTGVVLQTIDNTLQTGRVHVSGLDWTARTEQGGEVIPEKSLVQIERIEGVKLIVTPVSNEKSEQEGESKS